MKTSVKNEVIFSLIFRIGGMAMSFVATALIIRKLGASDYGVWAALISLLAWIQLSDFGVGYALKNIISSRVNDEKLVNLVSGVFQFFALISLGLSLIFLLYGNHLRIVQDYPTEAKLLYLATFIFFPLTIGTSVLQGLRKNSITAAFGFAQSLSWMLCVILIYLFDGAVFELALSYVIMMLFLGLWQFIYAVTVLSNGTYAWTSSLLKRTHIKLAIPLSKTGLQFILLQLSSVILFSLGTYLTYSNLSAKEAAKFDVLFKFFQVPLTIFNIVISVYWVEISRDISLKNSINLIKRYKQLLLISLVMGFIILILMVQGMPALVNLYTNHKIESSVSESLAFGVLISIQIFAYSGAVFLNAAELLKGQILLAIASAALLVPLTLIFFEQGFGIISVPLATTLLIIPSLIYCNWTAYFDVIKKNSP